MRHNDKIKNVADKEQVKSAERNAEKIRDRELSDLKIVLELPEGRRFIWRLLEQCKVFESIWHPSALIHHNSGKQDVGHFVMSEVVEASDERLLQMMKENKENNL